MRNKNKKLRLKRSCNHKFKLLSQTSTARNEGSNTITRLQCIICGGLKTIKEG